MPAKNKLIGLEFGQLVVLAEYGKDSHGNVLWLVKCSCGNEKYVSGFRLTSGEVKNCGCETVEKRLKSVQEDSMLGRVFDRLVVTRFSHRAHKRIFWECRCVCGGICYVATNSLLSGHTRSCGCFGKEQCRKACIKHGLSNTIEYRRLTLRIRREREKHVRSYWTHEMEMLLKQVQPCCILCGSVNRLCVDHVMPLSKGGSLRPGNVVRLCRSCNAKKHAKCPNDLPLQDMHRLLRCANDFYFACIQQKLYLVK